MRFTLDADDRLVSTAASELFAGLAGAPADRAWQTLAESGWAGVVRSAGAVGALLAAEQAGRHLLPLAFHEVALAAPAAMQLAGDRFERDAVESGREVWIPAGVDTLTVGLRGVTPVVAQKDGLHWSVSGQAWLVPAAPRCTGWLVVARHESARGEPLLLAVPAAHAHAEAVQSVDHTVALSRITFDASPAQGEPLPHRALTALLEWGAAGAAAELLGAAEHLRDMAVQHAREREQFGRPVGSFQAVKHHCANLHILTETLRVAVWSAALTLSSGGRPEVAVSVAKSYGGLAAQQVARIAHQVHGGVGFTWEYPLHYSLRRIERLAAAYGDAAWHRQRMGGLIVRYRGAAPGLGPAPRR